MGTIKEQHVQISREFCKSRHDPFIDFMTENVIFSFSQLFMEITYLVVACFVLSLIEQLFILTLFWEKSFVGWVTFEQMNMPVCHWGLEKVISFSLFTLFVGHCRSSRHPVLDQNVVLLFTAAVIRITLFPQIWT